MYGAQEQFDGDAAFGGGFMRSQATETATDTHFSPAKNKDLRSLVPLTVKQISAAFQSSDDTKNLLIDGVDVNNVKLVGIMLEKAERATDIQFFLDDGTGRIECHRWINEDLDTKEMERVSDGMYVTLHGHLKGFQGKKQVMIYSVRPVSDHNEITYHFADCMYVHSYNTRLWKLQDNSNTAAQVPNSSFNSPLKGYQAAPATSSHFAAQYDTAGITGIDKVVLNYLQQPSCISREKGVHRTELSQQLNMPAEKIVQVIESLEAEGLVYSTIDEFHYKSTANG